jgi:hypothetical protein
MISSEGLLAGASAQFDLEVPAALLGQSDPRPAEERTVRLRPLLVSDLRLITRAARDKDELTAALMVHQSLVEPALTLQEVSRMPVGLMEFLLAEVNRVSGITATEHEVMAAIEDPLAQASLRLSQAFGWTPEEIGRLTMGEVLTHLQFLKTA